MATLAALKFSSTDGAEQALTILGNLQTQHLVKVEDAAIVLWPEGKKKPKTRQMFSTTAAGAMGGAFWGMLFGLLFFVPFFGMALGAAMGALSGSMRDYGINDDFIGKVREKVTPGTSALFVLLSDATVDRVVDEMKKGPEFELIATNLSAEQEAQLREAFGEED